MALGLVVCVGVLGRGYWTPDEPREADLAWRMSWQPDKAVPLLAGEAFCEKPPLTYWAAAAAVEAGGDGAWVARLPNLLYALLTALAVGLLAHRCAGAIAGLAAAAAITTFLLGYQVEIWLATDAPLLAAVAFALLGLHVGFHAENSAGRLKGYTSMHLALAVGFLSKSAAAWMVPALAFATLTVWERRWRELTRWELYAGLLVQAAIVLPWVYRVYAGPDGPAHIKVFFWNNLIGRFAQVEAPDGLQYTSGHRNSPGKYLLELPVYLWPWTLLVAAAVRRAWRQRIISWARHRPVRFAAAAALPPLAVLSLAATARNIYLAPALPGAALLLGWWVQDLRIAHDEWDRKAIQATTLLLAAAAVVIAVGVDLVGHDSWAALGDRRVFVVLSTAGIAAALACTSAAWHEVDRGRLVRALLALLLAYSALLIGPASQIYARVDAWQNLAAIGRAMNSDSAGRPLLLFAPDETTRAFVDMYTRTEVGLIPGPVTPASERRLRELLAARPQTLIVAQLPGRNDTPYFRHVAARLTSVLGLAQAAPVADDPPSWTAHLGLAIARRYALPNGRRYALLERESATASR